MKNEALPIAISAALASLVLAACAAAPPPVKMSAMASDESQVNCPADATVVGGGYEIAPAARVAGKIPVVVTNRPTESGWKVECVDQDGKTVTTCKAFVLCATVLH